MILSAASRPFATRTTGRNGDYVGRLSSYRRGVLRRLAGFFRAFGFDRAFSFVFGFDFVFGFAFFIAGSGRLPCAGGSAVSRKRITASVRSEVPACVAPEIRKAGPR